MDNLPHLVVDEPKRSKKKFFALILISLMLLSLPLGVFLVSEQTQTRSQAGLNLREPETSLTFKTRDESEDLLKVDINIKSDIEKTNLADVKVNFDPNVLDVVEIATSSSLLKTDKKITPFATKWLETSFDNSSGVISLIGGSPNPGVKTDPQEGTEAILATISFRPKITSTTKLSFDPNSILYSEEGNVNLLKDYPEISLDVKESPQAVFPSSLPIISSNNKLSLQLNSPTIGNNYYYFGPLDIAWTGTDIESISGINLYLNGSFLGPIAQNIVSTGKYTWQPDQTVMIPYLQQDNSFQIEITARDKAGNKVSQMSGQFGLTTQQDEVTLGNNFVINSNLTIRDASKILSSYNIKPPQDQSLDLNQDGIINDLDLYLMRAEMLRKNIIR
jgi:hypothetical protein